MQIEGSGITRNVWKQFSRPKIKRIVIYISIICDKRFVIFQDKLLKVLKFSMSATTT